MNEIYTTTGFRIAFHRDMNSNNEQIIVLTLYGPNQKIGTATITANQLAGYIVKNNILNNEENKKFYKVVGYDENNGVFTEYGQYNDYFKALEKAEKVKIAIKKSLSGFETIDWVEIIQIPEGIIKWGSYEEQN